MIQSFSSFQPRTDWYDILAYGRNSELVRTYSPMTLRTENFEKSTVSKHVGLGIEMHSNSKN